MCSSDLRNMDTSDTSHLDFEENPPSYKSQGSQGNKVDDLPKGTKVEPSERDWKYILYSTPENEMDFIKLDIWGDNGIGEDGLYDLMEADHKLELWYDGKRIENGEEWLHALISGWIHDWGYSLGGGSFIDEETEDTLLDMLDLLTRPAQAEQNRNY